MSKQPQTQEIGLRRQRSCAGLGETSRGELGAQVAGASTNDVTTSLSAGIHLYIQGRIDLLTCCRMQSPAFRLPRSRLNHHDCIATGLRQGISYPRGCHKRNECFALKRRSVYSDGTRKPMGSEGAPCSRRAQIGQPETGIRPDCRAYVANTRVRSAIESGLIRAGVGQTEVLVYLAKCLNQTHAVNLIVGHRCLRRVVTLCAEPRLRLYATFQNRGSRRLGVA